MEFTNGNPERVPKPSRHGPRRAELADVPRGLASKRPAVTAGFLLLLGFGMGTQPGCRCNRTPPVAAHDGGAAPVATAWLAGSVVDRRARPVPEARVLAFALAAEGATPFEASTDLEGRFRFAHIPAG